MQCKWPTVKLEEVLSLSRESVEIDPLKTYRQITVRLHHNGVVLREEKIGQRIKSKRYLAKEGQFIISRKIQKMLDLRCFAEQQRCSASGLEEAKGALGYTSKEA